MSEGPREGENKGNQDGQMREDGIKGIKREDDGWLMGYFSSSDLFTCEVIGFLFFRW